MHGNGSGVTFEVDDKDIEGSMISVTVDGDGVGSGSVLCMRNYWNKNN